MEIPPSKPPRKADRLWQHTCFEAFVSVKSKPEYYEFNFAPSGEWAAYSFQRYRTGTPLEDDELAPRISVSNAADRLDLDAIVRLDRLPMISSHACLFLALSAVIEDENGKLSYWALKHLLANRIFIIPTPLLSWICRSPKTTNKPARKIDEVRNRSSAGRTCSYENLCPVVAWRCSRTPLR